MTKIQILGLQEVFQTVRMTTAHVMESSTEKEAVGKHVVPLLKMAKMFFSLLEKKGIFVSSLMFVPC